MASETTTRAAITLTGPQETLLATLAGRCHDAQSAIPILGDKWAVELAERLDYDFSKLQVDPGKSAGICLRARLLDIWTAEFLSRHRRATVVHLACGLDTRCQRVQHGPDVRWVDIDLPDVVKLRERIGSRPEGDYRLLGADAAAPDAWLASIPNDRPTIVVFEGLTMYMHEEHVRDLVQKAVSRFSSHGGQLAFDCFGTVALWLQSWMPAVEKTGSRLHFGADDGAVFRGWCPRLQTVDELRPWGLVNYDPVLAAAAVPWGTRAVMWVFSWIPWLRDSGRMLRFEF